jgi:hypothetical protein
LQLHFPLQPDYPVFRAAGGPQAGNLPMLTDPALRYALLATAVALLALASSAWLWQYGQYLKLAKLLAMLFIAAMAVAATATVVSASASLQ